MIRPLESSGHLPAAELQRAAMLTWGVAIESSVEDIRRAIADRKKRATVAIEDGELVGIVSWQPELGSLCPSARASSLDAHLTSLYVNPSLTGRGTGYELLHVALGQIREQGFTSVRLWCPECATRAHLLYERNGLALTGNQINHKGITRLERRRSVLQGRSRV